MLVAVTASGPDPAGQVDPRFGRAACFIIFDTGSGESRVLENRQDLGSGSGAGIQAAVTVAGAGAEWVLTGSVGPKAFRALAAAGIKVGLGLTGSIADAVALLQQGGVVPAQDANVEGHWSV